MIDSHCHLTAQQFHEDRNEIIKRIPGVVYGNKIIFTRPLQGIPIGSIVSPPLPLKKYYLVRIVFEFRSTQVNNKFRNRLDRVSYHSL